MLYAILSPMYLEFLIWIFFSSFWVGVYFSKLLFLERLSTSKNGCFFFFLSVFLLLLFSVKNTTVFFLNTDPFFFFSFLDSLKQQLIMAPNFSSLSFWLYHLFTAYSSWCFSHLDLLSLHSVSWFIIIFLSLRLVPGPYVKPAEVSALVCVVCVISPSISL